MTLCVLHREWATFEFEPARRARVEACGPHESLGIACFGRLLYCFNCCQLGWNFIVVIFSDIGWMIVYKNRC